MEELRWEPLGPLRTIRVSRAHGFGLDAFLLAQFAAPGPALRACDLGCGCGIIPLLWHRSPGTAPAETLCLDIQPQAIALLEETVSANGLAGQLLPMVGDLRRWRELPGLGRYDLVTCNPPYFVPGRGAGSREPSRRLARQESCTLEEVAAAAGGLLKNGGRFCICHRPQRLVDLLAALRTARLEPKRMRFVQKNPGSPPWLVLVEGRLGGGVSLAVEPPLYLEEDGLPSSELAGLYEIETPKGETENG